MSKYGAICPTCRRLYEWDGPAMPVPPCPKCSRETNREVRDALELVDEINGLVEDLPYEGEDFGLSVAGKAEEIGKNIEKHNRVTEKQVDALQNMLEGLRRWFHD